MKPRLRRLLMVFAGTALLGVAVMLVLSAFRSNLVFFYTPTQIAERQAPVGGYFRIGGLVKSGSLHRQTDGMTVRFVVTDTKRGIPVVYSGSLPDLFREGEGVVAEGVLRADGIFKAQQVLAKHDADYMPPEAAQALHMAGAGPERPQSMPVAARP